MANPLLLSTKKLAPELRERIVHNNLAYVEYNAISIESLPFNLPKLADYTIFSSQNATKVVLAKPHQLAQTQVLCVGEKSEKLFLKNGIKPLKVAQNMAELVHFIKKLDKNSSFVHFCGDRRLPLLATKMTEQNSPFVECVVYKTLTIDKKIDAHPQAVLFFSPSGVESYEKQHDLSECVCFCIGDTTANAITKKTKSIVVAQKSNAAAVVAKAIHFFKTQVHA